MPAIELAYYRSQRNDIISAHDAGVLGQDLAFDVNDLPLKTSQMCLLDRYRYRPADHGVMAGRDLVDMLSQSAVELRELAYALEQGLFGG